PAKQPSFRAGRKSAYAVPSAASPVALQTYWLSASCGFAALLAPSSLRFFSHSRPVRLSVTVPSPLSTNRSAAHGVPGNCLCSCCHFSAYLTRHLEADLRKTMLVPFVSSSARVPCWQSAYAPAAFRRADSHWFLGGTACAGAAAEAVSITTTAHVN